MQIASVKSLFSRLLTSVAIPVGIIVASLYIFNSLGSITYLAASVMAFAVGFFVIYLAFKYWINTDVRRETPEEQMTRFMIVFILNVAINTEIVYLMVTYLEVPLLTAQTVAAVIVAYESYYAYRSLVFRANKHTVAEELNASSGLVADELSRRTPDITAPR